MEPWFVGGMSVVFAVGSVLVRRDFGGSRVGWFVLGALLGPVGLLAALTVGGRWCPACDARIPQSIDRCPDCGTFLAGHEPEEVTSRPGPPPVERLVGSR